MGWTDSKICECLGIALFERTGPDTFRAASSLPVWWEVFRASAGFEIAGAESSATESSSYVVKRDGGFVDHFLTDAELHWQSGRSGRLRSGAWEIASQSALGQFPNAPPNAPPERPFVFELSAISANDQQILLVHSADLLGGDLHESLQRSRESKLVSEKELAQQQKLSHQMRAAKEAAENFTELKSRFLANMSHEVRTPLSGIMGMISLALTTENLPPEARRYLASAMESSDALLRIVNDVLDFSRVEAGKLPVRWGAVSVRDLLAEVHDHFDFHAREKDIQLCIQWSTTTPDIIRSDSVRLRQILFNLTENAIKFTHSGEVRVAARGTDDGQRVQFTVADTGMGISAADHNKIFEAFEQVEVTLTQQHGGTGLGLSIVQSLTTLLGGQIELESRTGEGTCFYLDFPVVGCVTVGTENRDTPISDEGETQEDVTLVEDNRLGGRTPQDTSRDSLETECHILVVEDNEINRQFIRRLLERLGYRVTIAATGAEAIAEWQGGGVELILMDCRMPEMDGFEAAEEIRRREQGTGTHVPIIALTAHAFGGFRDRCLERGMDDYLAKPFRQTELMALIQRYTVGHQLPERK